MNNKQIIKDTEEYVKKTMYGESTGHDWWHVYLVRKMAKRIAIAEKGDLFIVELAALLHDIADWKFNNDDLHAGARVAETWLKNAGVDTDTINKITEIIETVSFKGAKVDNKMKTLEGRIIWDADKLDIGAIGIARTFAYGGSKGRMIYDPDIKPILHDSFEQYKNSKSPSFNHFYEKILLLKDMMQTGTGRKIAKGRHEFLLLYMKQFLDEWNGIK